MRPTMLRRVLCAGTTSGISLSPLWSSSLSSMRSCTWSSLVSCLLVKVLAWALGYTALIVASILCLWDPARLHGRLHLTTRCGGHWMHHVALLLLLLDIARHLRA